MSSYRPTNEATLALAEVWASIDGNLTEFKKERDGKIKENDPKYTGHYVGYLVEAEEMLQRLADRGYHLLQREN